MEAAKMSAEIKTHIISNRNGEINRLPMEISL